MKSKNTYIYAIRAQILLHNTALPLRISVACWSPRPVVADSHGHYWMGTIGRWNSMGLHQSFPTTRREQKGEPGNISDSLEDYSGFQF